MNLVSKFWPLSLAIILSIVFHNLQGYFNEVDKLISKLIDSSLVVSGTLLGFLLTITTIMNAITTRRMNFVKQSGAYPQLQKFLNISITLNIITISLVIVIPFFYSLNPSEKCLKFSYSLQLLLVIWNWFASIRFTNVFINLLKEE
jgi:hypothetical protein